MVHKGGECEPIPEQEVDGLRDSKLKVTRFGHLKSKIIQGVDW